MLKNQVVAIFGAGRGIGKSIALECARHGASVALAARTMKEVEEVAHEIRDKYDVKVWYSTCDVASYPQTEAFVRGVENNLGPIDGLVCAAGIYGAIGPIDTTPPEEWRKSIEVNLIGTYHCVYAAVGGMKKRRKGHIVLFSGGGQGSIPNFSSYVSGKGGVWRLTETLGAELEPFGVYVNAVAPGLVNTRFLDDLLAAGPDKVGKDLYEKSLKQKSEGGISPDQAADCIVWLLSGESKTLAGKTISARWDDYRAIKDTDRYNKSDIYTAKRVVDFDGNTKVK